MRSLQDRNPLGRLRALVIRRLTADGISREDVLGDLEDLRQYLELNDRPEEEEVVMTVMDHVVGWCSPALSLARIGYSQYSKPFEDPLFQTYASRRLRPRRAGNKPVNGHDPARED